MCPTVRLKTERHHVTTTNIAVDHIIAVDELHIVKNSDMVCSVIEIHSFPLKISSRRRGTTPVIVVIRGQSFRLELGVVLYM